MSPMKKIITTALALVLTLGMSVTAFAAPSPSAEVKADSVTLADGRVVVPNVVKLDAATTETAKAKAQELVSADSQVLRAVEVTLDAAVSAENPVTLSFDLGNAVEAGTNLVALHLKDGSWEVLPCEWKNGKVNVTFTSLSPVVFVSKPATTVAKENNNYSPEYYESLKTNQSASEAADAGVTSPKTSDANVLGFALAAAVCGGALVCVNRKKTA